MLKQNKKNFLIMITHSLGEIDVLFPLIACMKKKYNIDVKMIFAVNKIYRQFKLNDFYRFCAKELDIKITKCQLPNKFDYRDSLLGKNLIGRRLISIYFRLLKMLKIPLLLPKLYWADAYMHEFSNQVRSTYLLYWAKKRFNKIIFCYIHGHAVNMNTNYTKNNKISDEVILLNFHEHNRKTMENLGYSNQFIIGYPKFNEEWMNLVNVFPGSEFKDKEIVVIFSRHIHPTYMDRDKYINLIITSFKAVRDKLGDIQIVIKPHPREETFIINEILQDQELNNYCFSREDASLLSQYAVLAISFWTSAILASLACGVPSIEYYIEAKNFRKIEPEGSVYKKLGIDSVDNSLDLNLFIDRVISRDHQIPLIVNELTSINNVDFINMIK